MTATEKVLDKLAKLKAHADSAAQIGNTAEAEAFAGMINSMLLRYELSIEDIPMNRQDAEDPVEEVLVDPRKHGLKFSRSRSGWQERLAGIVAKAHLCRILVHPGTNFVTFVGTKSHVAVAEHAYGVLAGAADRMSTKARDEYWRLHRNDPDFDSGNYRAGWIRGFIYRISEKFEEARRREVSEAPVGSSTALIRLNQALVRVNAYLEAKKGTRKAAATTVGRGIGRAERDGRAAADRMNIGQRGINSGSNRRPLLGE